VTMDLRWRNAGSSDDACPLYGRRRLEPRFELPQGYGWALACGLARSKVFSEYYCTSESRPILLAAAAEQFAKYGPRGTRAQDIVNAAGINQRMICHHFGSKDALYAGVMREQRARLGGSWRPILERAVTMGPYPGMQLALGSFFNALLAGPQVEALFAHEGLGDAQLAFPEGFSGLPVPVRPLHELTRPGSATRS
jgi:tetracycline repressor-like protein